MKDEVVIEGSQPGGRLCCRCRTTAECSLINFEDAEYGHKPRDDSLLLGAAENPLILCSKITFLNRMASFHAGVQCFNMGLFAHENHF